MRTILSLIVVCTLATGAFALPKLSTGQINGNTPSNWSDDVRNDPIVWDNGAPTNANGFSSQDDVVYPFNSQVADDFTLHNANGDATPTLVTGVQWGGVYWNGTGNADGFNILFYNNDGTGQAKSPTGRGLPDPSPTAILNQFVPLAGSNQTLVAAPSWYSYNAKLQVPFLAEKDVKYWIGIQARRTFPPQWGWTTSVSNSDNVAQQGFPLLGLPYWGPADGIADMSYALSGFKVPEPTSLGLLGLGGLALIRRRR